MRFKNPSILQAVLIVLSKWVINLSSIKSVIQKIESIIIYIISNHTIVKNYFVIILMYRSIRVTSRYKKGINKLLTYFLMTFKIITKIEDK